MSKLCDPFYDKVFKMVNKSKAREYIWLYGMGDLDKAANRINQALRRAKKSGRLDQHIKMRVSKDRREDALVVFRED